MAYKNHPRTQFGVQWGWFFSFLGTRVKLQLSYAAYEREKFRYEDYYRNKYHSDQNATERRVDIGRCASLTPFDGCRHAFLCEVKAGGRKVGPFPLFAPLIRDKVGVGSNR